MGFVIEAYSAQDEESLRSIVHGASGGAGLTADISSPSSAPSSAVPIENEVQNVLDVLPHLGAAFVRKLLSRYDNTESAIAAVLEGNLPPDLDESNPDLVKESPMKEPKPNQQIDDMTKSLNDVALGINESIKIIIKGDKRQADRPKQEKRVLNDKSHIHDLKTRYQEYGYVSENEYDDEYDDSYDALAESETKSAAKLLRKSGAMNVVVDEVDEESEEDEDHGTDGRDKTRDFCENPEAARERYAQRHMSRFPNRAPKPQAEVAGKPKGQGQDKDTVVNRHKKDVNKSSRANHNRRQGAAFKRNRGMIPS